MGNFQVLIRCCVKIRVGIRIRGVTSDAGDYGIGDERSAVAPHFEVDQIVFMPCVFVRQRNSLSRFEEITFGNEQSAKMAISR